MFNPCELVARTRSREMSGLFTFDQCDAINSAVLVGVLAQLVLNAYRAPPLLPCESIHSTTPRSTLGRQPASATVAARTN